MTRLATGGGFVRSMATRGVLGGLSAATADAVHVLEAAGFEWILVETVGVGQDEIDVAAEVDTVVVLLPPGSGDEIQTAKAGLLEIADVFVVNKADQPGSAQVARALEAMLDLAGRPAWRAPVLQCVARRSEGVEAIIEAIERHGAFLERSGVRAERRRERLGRRFDRVLAVMLLDAVRGRDEEALREAREDVQAGRSGPVRSARRIVARNLGEDACE